MKYIIAVLLIYNSCYSYGMCENPVIRLYEAFAKKDGVSFNIDSDLFVSRKNVLENSISNADNKKNPVFNYLKEHLSLFYPSDAILDNTSIYVSDIFLFTRLDTKRRRHPNYGSVIVKMSQPVPVENTRKAKNILFLLEKEDSGWKIIPGSIEFGGFEGGIAMAEIALGYYSEKDVKVRPRPEPRK